jgi:hypothetical protein
MCLICTFQREQPILLNNEQNLPRLGGAVAKRIDDSKQFLLSFTKLSMVDVN